MVATHPEHCFRHSLTPDSSEQLHHSLARGSEGGKAQQQQPPHISSLVLLAHLRSKRKKYKLHPTTMITIIPILYYKYTIKQSSSLSPLPSASFASCTPDSRRRRRRDVDFQRHQRPLSSSMSPLPTTPTARCSAAHGGPRW